MRRVGYLALVALVSLSMIVPAQDGRDNLSRGMITPAAQEAVDAGLRYLERSQSSNGAFGTGPQNGNVAITSLAGLALMAGGHQPGRGPYGKNVRKALEYVLGKEDPRTPGFLNNVNSPLHGPMYSHGFATLFLAEAHGMVQDPVLKTKLRDTLERAVKLIIKSQNSQGGWRYRPVAQDADISVTICQIMALRAARNAGISVPKSTADKCSKYVKDCQDRASGGFYYQVRSGHPGFARTAAGVVALYSAGEYEGESVEKGLAFLKNYQPGNARGLGDHEARYHYFYGHYYAAQAMWIAGGNYWKNWFPAIRDELLTGAHRQNDGSWWDQHHCRHYCTAMAMIILQIPNNYLPILQR